MKKVYLAGPDVFFRDCAAIFAARAQCCASLGLQAVVPADEKATAADDIFRSNVTLIESADGVIANLSPFRGPHCDVGTAWEIAYAIARSKPVFAFSSDPRPLAERLRIADPDGRDADGYLVENFGLAENLMIAVPLFGRTVHRSFDTAAAAAARHFRAAPRV